MKKIENKTDAMKLIETKIGGELEEILRRLYVDEDLPVSDICKKLGISYTTAIRWLRLSGVYSRRLKVDYDS